MLLLHTVTRPHSREKKRWVSLEGVFGLEEEIGFPLELHGRLYGETLVSLEVMWSHECCDNAEKKWGARWCLTSNAASRSSGNSRSWD